MSVAQYYSLAPTGTLQPAKKGLFSSVLAYTLPLSKLGLGEVWITLTIVSNIASDAFAAPTAVPVIPLKPLPENARLSCLCGALVLVIGPDTEYQV